MARASGFDKWCQTVKVGDMIGATNPRSEKGHIIIKLYHKTKTRSRDGTEDFSMVGGTSLCGTRGEGWWWSICQSSDPEVFEEGADCPYCHRRFRNLENPRLRNFVREASKNVTEDDESLPFGWKKLPSDETVQKTEWNYGKDHILFQGVSVWRRGPRMIAIGKVTEQTSGEKYPLLTARKWIEEKDWDTNYRCSTMEQAVKSAYDLMAEGGY